MDQARLLPPDLSQHEPDHPHHRQRRRDHLGLRTKILRQPANAEPVTFGAHRCHPRAIAPVLGLFIGNQRDPVIARKTAQIGQHLALAERFQQTVAGQIDRGRLHRPSNSRYWRAAMSGAKSAARRISAARSTGASSTSSIARARAGASPTGTSLP